MYIIIWYDSNLFSRDFLTAFSLNLKLSVEASGLIESLEDDEVTRLATRSCRAELGWLEGNYGNYFLLREGISPFFTGGKQNETFLGGCFFLDVDRFSWMIFGEID